MAINLTPSVLFGSNYGFSDPDITISNSDNTSISNAEADASTGDFRRVLYGLLTDIYSRYNQLAAQDKSGKMTFLKNSTFNDATNTGVVTFTVRFNVGAFEAEVADED